MGVASPRFASLRSAPQQELNRTYLLAATADADLYEAVWNLQDAEEEVDKCGEKINECSSTLDSKTMEFWRFIQHRREETELLSDTLQARRTNSRHRSSPSNGNDSDYAVPLSAKHLANISANLTAAHTAVRVCESSWTSLTKLNANLTSHINGTLDSKFEQKWKQKIYFVLGTVAGFLSLLIVWSEVFMGLGSSLSPFGLLLSKIRSGEDVEARAHLIEFFAFVPLLYMSACVYGSLFKMRIFGNYGLRRGECRSRASERAAKKTHPLLNTLQRFERRERFDFQRRIFGADPISSVLQLLAVSEVRWERRVCLHAGNESHGDSSIFRHPHIQQLRPPADRSPLFIHRPELVRQDISVAGH